MNNQTKTKDELRDLIMAEIKKRPHLWAFSDIEIRPDETLGWEAWINTIVPIAPTKEVNDIVCAVRASYDLAK